MLLLQQSVLQQLCRVELLSYDGKKGDKKSFCSSQRPVQVARLTLKVKATSSLGVVQLRAEKRYKLPLLDGHSGVFHALLFQWFWGRSLKL